MSQENVESYRRAVAAWLRGDLDAVLPFVEVRGYMGREQALRAAGLPSLTRPETPG